MKHPRKRFKGSVITTIATGSVIALALTLGAMNLTRIIHGWAKNRCKRVHKEVAAQYVVKLAHW